MLPALPGSQQAVAHWGSGFLVLWVPSHRKCYFIITLNTVHHMMRYKLEIVLSCPEQLLCASSYWKVEHMKRGNHLGDLVIDRMIILKWVFKKYGVRALTGFIWLRIGSIGRVLCTQ